jgi:hypothetical protein
MLSWGMRSRLFQIAPNCDVLNIGATNLLSRELLANGTDAF